MNLESLQKINRYQACLSHFVISLMIFLFLLGIIVFIWYPGDLIHAGGWQGIKIVAGVDLVLGPLLTLVIYNPKKKSLPFDLLIIALIQISALGYGVWNVYNEKPGILVLSYDGFYIVPSLDVKHYNLFDNISDEISINRPIMVAMDPPDDIDKSNEIIWLNTQAGSTPFEYRADLYLFRLPNEKILQYQTLFNNEKNNKIIKAPFKNRHIPSQTEVLIQLDPLKYLGIFKPST